MSGYWEGDDYVSNEDIWAKMNGVITSIDATDDYLVVTT